jgi:hypothetical protein
MDGMTRLLATFVLGTVLLASGCVIHRGHPVRSRSQAVVVRQPSCHPSQYWDGHKCRHKGKGHGARKHDN